MLGKGFPWLRRLFAPQVRVVRTEWRVMNAAEREAFDRAFAKMDEAFGELNRAFDQVDK